MAHIEILNRVRPDHPAFARAREDAVKAELEQREKAEMAAQKTGPISDEELWNALIRSQP